MRIWITSTRLAAGCKGSGLRALTELPAPSDTGNCSSAADSSTPNKHEDSTPIYLPSTTHLGSDAGGSSAGRFVQPSALQHALEGLL